MNIYAPNQGDIIHETSVDFVLRSISREIHVVQYDTLTIIKVNLFNNGERYVLPESAKVNVRFCQLENTEIYKSVLGCNSERNAVYFDIDEEMSSLKGTFEPVLEIFYSPNKRGCSSPILIDIERNPIKKTNL